jgi:hypothetical protein
MEAQRRHSCTSLYIVCAIPKHSRKHLTKCRIPDGLEGIFALQPIAEYRSQPLALKFHAALKAFDEFLDGLVCMFRDHKFQKFVVQPGLWTRKSAIDLALSNHNRVFLPIPCLC